MFGVQDFSGFDCDKWVPRSVEQHREDIESEVGCRYYCLLQLPYFDPVKMTVIDPMHNLYLGTAKRVSKATSYYGC